MVGTSGELSHYTKIWNPILYVLARANLTASQYRCIMALYERTYRWNGRKTRALSYKDWAEATGLPRRSVERTVKQLVAANVFIVVEEASFTRAATYQLNKDVRQWDKDIFDEELPNDIAALLVEECGTVRDAAYTTQESGDRDSTRERVDPAQSRRECTRPRVEGSTRQCVLSPSLNPHDNGVSRPPKENTIKKLFKEKEYKSYCPKTADEEPTSKSKAPTATEKCQEIYTSLPDDDREYFENYIQVYRDANKTGRIAPTRELRLLRELKEIYDSMQFSFNQQTYTLPDLQIFREGLEAMFEAGADNINYPKKVWISKIRRRAGPDRKKNRIVDINTAKGGISRGKGSGKWSQLYAN